MKINIPCDEEGRDDARQKWRILIKDPFCDTSIPGYGKEAVTQTPLSSYSILVCNLTLRESPHSYSSLQGLKLQAIMLGPSCAEHEQTFN